MPEKATPTAFISYSRDSDSHMSWVRELSEKLTANGISVILDQWETGPGHEVTAFMEKHLISCDWVLIVCTEEYIRKANTLIGGVGYERMIVTAHVARDLETTKFIPILRMERSEAVPTFLGSRIYVDLRGDDFNEIEYDRLLRTLHGAPKFTKPVVGPNPYVSAQIRTTSDNDRAMEARGVSLTSKAMGEQGMEGADWNYHWHRAVHEYCGNTLYLILLRFTKGSIFLKDSIIEDLQEALITDFKIFHLYSPWDILIRAWADKDSIEALRARFAVNSDIHVDKRPEYLLVEHLEHMSESGPYADIGVANKILSEASLTQLREVQEGSNLTNGFEMLKSQGLLVDDVVRFDPTRIQFFITISSGEQLDVAAKTRIQRLANREWPGIFNRSVYMTPGASIQAVLKGQAEEYYNIHTFLRAVTDELKGEDISTETMLVANCEPRDSKKIDFGRAEAYVIDNEFQELLPRHSRVRLAERLMLQSLFADVWPKLHEDRHNVLRELIRAKAGNTTKGIGAALSLFFPPFENGLKRHLVAVIVNLYGGEWQASLDALKKREKLEAKSHNQFVLGDLCKVYKRIVLDKRIIDIRPLSDEEFSSVMDAAPVKRNEFAHGEETVLKQWDDWFSFCARFVPIHHRLIRYLENLNERK